MKNHNSSSYGNSLVHILGATQRHIEKAIAERISETPLRISQVPFILLLGEKPGLPQKDICDYLSLEQPTVASTLKKLEREECLFRQIDKQDKRITRYYLTKTSLELLPKIQEITDAVEEKIVSKLENIDITTIKRDIITVEAAADPVWKYARRWEKALIEDDE